LVLKLCTGADHALQIAAVAHDIDRAVPGWVRREDYSNYDTFKEAHAQRGARMLRGILEECGVENATVKEACRLVKLHEVGGDARSDLLRDADSISFFQVNMHLYYQREGWEEAMRRCVWGYRRLSEWGEKIVETMPCHDDRMAGLLKAAIRQACLK
jgi:Domain of unknown function (DUF4202)